MNGSRSGGAIKLEHMGVVVAGVLFVLAGQAVAAEKYVVAYEIDYHGAERYVVMAETNFNARLKEVAVEVGQLARAKLAARNTWTEEERARVKKLRDEKMKADASANKAGGNNANALAASLKGDKIKYRGFPSLDINMNPEVRSMGMYDSPAEAEERCKVFAKQLDGRNKAEAEGPKTIMRMEDKMPSFLKKPTGEGKKKRDTQREADENADIAKAMALFEKCLEQVKSTPVEERKVVVEGASFEKGMKDTRTNVKKLGM